MGHNEPHRIRAIGWLRAAVLGANDGIISTASLLIGVASAHAEHGHPMLTGLAVLVAGAMSMATGEYVSVCHKRIQKQLRSPKSRQNWMRMAHESIESWRRFTCGAARYGACHRVSRLPTFARAQIRYARLSASAEDKSLKQRR